jgi:long-chain acyl-CoA synthetase
MGYLDDAGYLFISDRKADTIISGGVNIYPAEIEAVLLEHAAVKDCCVVGIKDDEWGESVLGAIQLLDNTDDVETIRQDIEQHCRARLAGYQVPRQLVFEENLPRTETGKIKRREIRDQYRALYSTHTG